MNRKEMLTLRNKSVKQRKAVVNKNTTHGMRYSTEYESWRGAKSRCDRPTHRRYKDYGGRGIKFCKEWETFGGFYADMGDKPSPQHSLDRIDNGGDYCKDNCRWATPTEQANNVRKRKDNKSGVVGVAWHKATKKWIAYGSRDGKQKYIGVFDSFGDACEARKSFN